ncbi:MAG: GNAT family N-acetyltransferase [Nanoarchaeota archaeon]|nr:GNAT family N-acetyltransferase [Nanoarchaeota archaeon]
MEFRICQDIDEGCTLWNKFSPNKRLFDIWDYRLCFYDSSDNEPYFIVGYENGEAIALVPLCFIKSKNQYTYFGGWFPERNSFFLKDKTKLAQLLERCPENTFIEGIDHVEGKYYDFLEDEYTYYLDLSKYGNDFERYFSSFDKKKQKNFNRDLRNMPKYQIYHNRLQDFDRLVELNVKQYEEDSKFNNKTIKKGIYKMINLANKGNILEMMSLEINGKTEAVDIGIVHEEWYYAIIGGANNQKIPNLGKLMTILDIKNAIARRARFVDFFATSGYWKNTWHFDKEMLLKFVK